MKMTLSTRRLSWALLLTIPLWFGACSTKNNDVTPDAAAIQGSWRITAYTIDPAFDLLGDGNKTNDLLVAFKAAFGQDFVDCFKAITLTFNADGKITGTTTAACNGVQASPVDNGAMWALTGGKLRITDSTGMEEYDVSTSGTTLKLSQSATDDFDNDGKNETVVLSLLLTKA